MLLTRNPMSGTRNAGRLHTLLCLPAHNVRERGTVQAVDSSEIIPAAGHPVARVLNPNSHHPAGQAMIRNRLTYQRTQTTDNVVTFSRYHD